MVQVKERGGVGEERKKKVSFHPLPLPHLSLFGSRFISRAVITENPFPRIFFAPKPNACYAGYLKLFSLGEFESCYVALPCLWKESNVTTEKIEELG